VTSVVTFDARFGQAIQSVRSGKMAAPSSSILRARSLRSVVNRRTTSAPSALSTRRAPEGSGASRSSTWPGSPTTA
jgi:hypothetical protein